MAADLQVSIAFLLENQAEVAAALAAEGGRAGDAFRNKLTPAAQKAFDDLVQGAEKAAKDVGLRFNKTKLQFETAKGDLVPSATLDKISRLSSGFAEARKSVDVFKSAVTTASKEAASSLNLLEAAVTGVAVSLTQQLSNAAIGGLAGIKNMVTGFMELDTELRSAAAAAGESDGYERLGAIVDKVGIDAAGTSKQVAELATSLVKAGFNVGEVETALPGVVRGAEATGTAFERFGEITGSTLRQFGLEASEISRVTDVLAQTVNQTNATTEGFAYAMNEAAPVAKALGISLEDTAAAVGIMANAGLQGSVAGTGLKTMMLKLQQAAGGATPEILGLAQGQERLAKIMKIMGGDVLDASGKMLPLDQVFIKLKSSMDQLSQGDRAALATALFGEDGGPKFLAIVNQGSSAIEKVFGKVRNSKGAVDEARAATNGFERQLTQLTGTLDSLATGVGRVAADGLTPFLGLANQVIGAMAAMPGPIKDAAASIAIIGATAVAAGIGIAGLNAAAGMLGGWAAMAKSISLVGVVLSGPIAGSIGIVIALGAAAFGAYGAFNGLDSSMKKLVQTAGALGAFLMTLRALKIAQEGWTAATKATGVAQAFLTALQGPKGLVQIGIAAGVAAGAYALLGNAIKDTGAETEALSGKSKTLKDEIASLGQQIEQGKKLKIDTTDLEKVKAAKELDLQALENPLEIKLNIQKAEGQIKSLQEQKDKLGKDAPATASLDAQIKAAEKYRDVLKAAEEGVGGKGFAKLDEVSKKFVKDQQDIKNKIQGLMEQKIKLNIDDKAGRDNIDKQIASLQTLASKNEIKFKAGIDISKLQTELEVARAKLEQAQVPISKGRFESNDNFSKREAEQKQKIFAYTQQTADLQAKLAAAQGQSVGAAEQQANAAAKQVQSEKAKLDALKANLEASKSKLENEQRGIDLGNRLMSLDKGRLETIRQMADAYMSMASAQAGLTQSEFDVKGARNNRNINVANEEIQAIRDSGQEMLQYMRDRGASQDQIAAKEREIADAIKSKENEIKDLKERGKQIEQEALAAAIEGAAKRFEMERKVLELKQMAMKLEQEAAVRAAERSVLEDKKGLAELKGKRLDPDLTDGQKAAIDEQIKLQQQSIELSNAQVKAEKERLGQLGQIFAMEKDTLALKQGTEANQFRAKAAEQGTEGTLKPQLDQLDQSKGKIGENKMAWDDVTKQADKVLGVINAHNKAIKEGTKSVGDLAKQYQQAKPEQANMPADKKQAGPIESARTKELAKQKAWQKQMEDAGIIQFQAEGVPKSETDAIIKDILGVKDSISADPSTSSLDGVRNQELDRQKDWQKKMEDAGFIEFKAQGVPQSVTDAIMNDAVMGTNSPIVDQWFASKEGQAAMEKWRQSAASTASELHTIDSAAMQAAGSVDGLNASLEEAANTPKGLQQMQDNLFGQKARDQLFSPEAIKKAMEGNDFSLQPKVDTSAAQRDLAAFRQQETRDPLELPIKPAGFDAGAGLANIRGPVQDFINQLKTTNSPDQTINFQATGLDQIRTDLGLTGNVVDAFKASAAGVGTDLSMGFMNASGALFPLSDQIRGLGEDFQNLNTGTDPFASVGTSLGDAAAGTDEINGSLQSAIQSIQGFDQALANNPGAEQLQQAYDNLQPPDVGQAVNDQATLADGTQGTVAATQGLADSWVGVADNIRAAVDALAAFSTPQAPARFAGGGVQGGQDYTVNELGPEAFLSATGTLSRIRAPQYGHWVAPSRGMVLPANVTAHLDAMGAFDRGRGAAPARQMVAAMARPQGNRSDVALIRLQRSIDKLEKTMGTYRPPSVEVQLPNNAGLLHKMQSFG